MKAEEATVPLSSRDRTLAVWAALIALFLGALDSLVMSAAMPSIVAELGGLHLYAWVYSAYFLARAVALPVFGKLADLYDSKSIFLFTITLFICASVAAGVSGSMAFLIVSRVFQGLGAGGNFALVYIVLSRVAAPGKRAQTLSLGSSIWGISSVIGPTLGGFIVSYFSWRWIFFINIPIGFLSLAGIALFLRLPRVSGRRVALDVTGIFLFSCFVLGLLIIFTIGGRDVSWTSLPMLLIAWVTFVLGLVFYQVEKKAADPLIEFRFFRKRDFSLGNGAVFFSSFSIFSFFAYAPLYIQGALGLSPMQVGIAMVSLSLGWSFGALCFGRVSSSGGERAWAIIGGAVLLAGSLLTLRFSLQTTMTECFIVFFLVGIGMGFVSLATLIIVQNSTDDRDLGMVTSFHQFCRSLGGTVGVGICGGIVTTGLFSAMERSTVLLPQSLVISLRQGIENVLLPEFQRSVPAAAALDTLRDAVFSGVFSAFIFAACSSFLCLLCCLLLSRSGGVKSKGEAEVP